MFFTGVDGCDAQQGSNGVTQARRGCRDATLHIVLRLENRLIFRISIKQEGRAHRGPVRQNATSLLFRRDCASYGTVGTTQCGVQQGSGLSFEAPQNTVGSTTQVRSGTHARCLDGRRPRSNQRMPNWNLNDADMAVEKKPTPSLDHPPVCASSPWPTGT